MTNIEMNHFEEAVEKIQWYCFRWRREVFHKILKSGLKVEECRLGTADRLIRYLTIMSVIDWRIFFITLIARAHPNLPFTCLLSDDEWKGLYTKIYNTKPYPTPPPTIKETVRWVARLGVFLARKNDGEPGLLHFILMVMANSKPKNRTCEFPRIRLKHEEGYQVLITQRWLYCGVATPSQFSLVSFEPASQLVSN